MKLETTVTLVKEKIGNKPNDFKADCGHNTGVAQREGARVGQEDTELAYLISAADWHSIPNEKKQELWDNVRKKLAQNVDELTAKDVNMLSENIINSLKPEELNALSSEQRTILNETIRTLINKRSDSAIRNLQLNMLTTDQFNTIESSVIDNYKKTLSSEGTTALTCVSEVITENNKKYVHISGFSIADPTLHIVKRDKVTGKISHCERLNSNLHKPEDPHEMKRLEEIGIPVVTMSRNKFYVNGKLNVARALGDRFLDSEGKQVIISDPEFIDQKFEITPNEEIYIIAACDGLTEVYPPKSGTCTGNTAKDVKFLTELFEAILPKDVNKSSHQIAEELANKAYNSGSKDNISVIVRKMDENSQPFVIGIYDGHGGDRISKFVAEILPNILNEQLKIILEEHYKKQVQMASSTTSMQQTAAITREPAHVSSDDAVILALNFKKSHVESAQIHDEDLDALYAKIAAEVYRSERKHDLNEIFKKFDAAVEEEKINYQHNPMGKEIKAYMDYKAGQIKAHARATVEQKPLEQSNISKLSKD